MRDAVVQRRYTLSDRLLLYVVCCDLDGLDGIRFGNRFDA